MRILFCNKYNFRFSGTEAYLFSLMDLLRSAGHEVALFSMDWGRRSETQYPQYLVPRLDFKEAGRRPWTAPRRSAHMMYSLSARQQIRQAVRDFRPDVAHVRNIYHHLSPSILWELRSQNIPVLYQVNDFKLVCPSYNLVSRGHLCTRCHGGAFWHLLGESCYPGPRYASVLLAVEAYLQRTLRTYRKCISRIVAPSEFVREVLVGNGWDADKIDVLYHFQSVARQPVRASVHNAPILYFGRLSAEKGIDDLLRAMQSNRQIPLLIAGEGPGAPELNRLATALNLDNVTFLGKLVGERLDAAIASSQFTVFPSRAPEVLGKTILESYAHSKAVIASDLGSRRELVLAGETGLLYPTGEYQKLAKAIARLYAEPELAQEMGAAGRQLLLKRHTPDQHLSTLTGIYERVRRESVQKPALGRKGPSRPLRIAFIGGRGVISKYSGIESFYEEVGQRLVQRKHEVTVYCRNYFTPPVKSYSGMRIIRLPTIRTKHLDTFVHTLLSTLHATFSDVDIVHYHTLGPALFSFMPQLAGKKTLVTVQGLDWQRKKWGRAASLVLRLGEWAAGTFPNLTVVVSRALQEHYRSHNYKSTVLIPNGTVLREREGADYLRSCNLEPDGYILFLGRLSPENTCKRR